MLINFERGDLLLSNARLSFLLQMFLSKIGCRFEGRSDVSNPVRKENRVQYSLISKLSKRIKYFIAAEKSSLFI